MHGGYTQPNNVHFLFVTPYNGHYQPRTWQANQALSPVLTPRPVVPEWVHVPQAAQQLPPP